MKKYHDITVVTPQLIEDIKLFFDRVLKTGVLSNYQDTEFNIKLGEKIDYFTLCEKLYYISCNATSKKKNLTTIIDKKILRIHYM